MTREHLVEDIQNVLELVSRVEKEGGSTDEARRALEGIYRHIADEEGVPMPVEGCLREAISQLEETQNPAARAWRDARACLEVALDFAQN